MANEIKINRGTTAAVLAEFLGTAALVMVALVLSETTAVSYFIGTSAALAIAAVYMMFSRVSGAYVNPAITFGMWTVRRIKTVRAVAYIVAQLLGGLASWQLYQYFTNHHLAAHNTKFSMVIFLAELVGTAVLALGFSAAMSKAMTTLESAFTYGASLFAGIVIASTASAGYLNPSVALGVHSFSWVYIVGPLAGGLLGINLYHYLFASGKK